MAEQQARQFWHKVRKAAPKAKLFQLVGNHDIRPLRRAVDKVPEFEHIVEEWFARIMSFDHVETIFDPREELEVDDYIVIHGHKTKLGDHMMESHENIVCAHTHKPGVVYHPWGGKAVFEANCGFQGDRLHRALSYTARKKFSKWSLAIGIEMDGHGPRVVPFTGVA